MPWSAMSCSLSAMASWLEQNRVKASTWSLQPGLKLHVPIHGFVGELGDLFHYPKTFPNQVNAFGRDHSA